MSQEKELRVEREVMDGVWRRLSATSNWTGRRKPAVLTPVGRLKPSIRLTRIRLTGLRNALLHEAAADPARMDRIRRLMRSIGWNPVIRGSAR